MEIVIGTYEELILGYKFSKCDNEYDLKTSFTDHSHTGCVRTVAISEQGFLASGSSDESIRLFNLKKRKEIGSLVHHNGYISHLRFYKKSHMFSCSADGTIGIWKTGNWECKKTLRGHKDAVSCVTVHPSGKLALSVSRDKMHTWNLITGKCAYKTSVKGAELVLWTPDGSNYLITSTHVVDVYSVESAAVIHSIKVDFRINCVDFVEDNIIAIAGEGGNVQLHDLEKKADVLTISTDTIRVKAQAVCKCGDGVKRLVTGSSDGYIKVWRLSQKKGKWSSLLECSTDTKFRIVSLAVRVESPNLDTSTKSEKISTEERNIAEKSEDSEEESHSLEEEYNSDVSDSDIDDDDAEEEEEKFQGLDIVDSDLENNQSDDSNSEESVHMSPAELDSEEYQGESCDSEDSEAFTKTKLQKNIVCVQEGSNQKMKQKNKKRKHAQTTSPNKDTKKRKQNETSAKKKAKKHQLKSASLKKQKLKSKH